jgi:hypothetical protein
MFPRFVKQQEKEKRRLTGIGKELMIPAMFLSRRGAFP